MRLQALRGATTCDQDTSEEIEVKIGALLQALFERNGLTTDDVVSVIFTTTPDLTSQFPATAARAAMDLGDVALLGAQEQQVADATPRCVRVLIHCYTERPATRSSTCSSATRPSCGRSHPVTTGLPSELPVTGPAPLRGRLRVPGDKGISHRALMFAALADGVSRITGLPGGDDVLRTGRALRALGVDVRRVTGETGATSVEGVGYDGLTEPTQVIDCGNSGTTMRTLCGLVAGRDFLAVLTGDACLVARPMARVVTPLRAMGARLDGRADGELPPLVVAAVTPRRHTPPTLGGKRPGEDCHCAGGNAGRGTTEISEPTPSRDHTERMLAALGAPLSRIDRRTVRLRPGPLTAFELDVPGDPSSAAFWVGRRADHARLRSRARGSCAQPHPTRLRRRAAAHGCGRSSSCRPESTWASRWGTPRRRRAPHGHDGARRRSAAA